MSRLTRGAGAVGILAGLLVQAPARADDTAELEGLLNEPIVTTASHAQENESTAPATSTTFTAEDLRRYGIRSLDEAINFLSLGMVTANPLRAAEIGARGVLISADFGNHVLLLVNGHAMNELWYGTQYVDRGAGIPFELIDHVEVILGPGSPLYGSYAMLGVINVVTKRAKDYPGLHLIGESEVGAKNHGTTAGLVGVGPAEITSGRFAVGTGYTFSLFGKPGEITSQVEYYSHRGPAFLFGPQNAGVDSVTGEPKRFSPDGPPTGIWGGVASRSYFIQVPTGYMRVMLGGFELNLRATMYRRGTPYENDVNVSATRFDDPHTYEQDRWVSGDLKHTAILSPHVQLLSRVYGDAYDYRLPKVISMAEDCGATYASGCRHDTLGVSKWVGSEVRFTIDWLKDSRYQTTLGADGRLRTVEDRYSTTDAATGVTELVQPPLVRNDATLGLYAQQTARPLRWLGANVGLRTDFDERYGSRLSPRMAVSATPWRGGTFKSIYASAFRSPSIYELTYTEVPGTLPQLAPESVRSIEGSFEQRFGAQRLIVGVFRSWWSDLILYLNDYVAEVGSYGNFGTLDNYGANAGYEGAFLQGKLRAALNVTHAHSRRTTSGAEPTPLPASPSTFGNARISYDLPNGLPTVALAGHVAGSSYADRAFDGGFTPVPMAPTRLTLRGTLTGPVPSVVGLSYRLTATFTTAERSPYVVGPLQAATPEHPSAELAPIDRFRMMLGLQYDFAQ